MKKSAISAYRAPVGALALIIALLGQNERARASNEISMRLSNTFAAGDELAPLSQDSTLVQAELSYARALWRFGRTTLWAEGAYAFGRREARLFSGLQTDTWFHQLTAGLRCDVALLRWLTLHARAGAGLGLASLSLEPSGNASSQLDDSSDLAFAAAGHVLAGLQLLWPRRWGALQAGLVVEGGAMLTSDFNFTLGPEVDEDLVRLPLSQSELGAVNLTGAVVRAGAFLRF